MYAKRGPYAMTRRSSSTTLSDPRLTNPLFGLLHPVHVPRATDEEQTGEDFLDEGAYLRKREPRSGAAPHPFRLQEGIRHGADHHVMLPARISSPFEVVEA